MATALVFPIMLYGGGNVYNKEKLRHKLWMNSKYCAGEECVTIGQNGNLFSTENK